jgi:hypothetical protein
LPWSGGIRIASWWPPARPIEVRLAELVATLSLGTDLGLGQPMEHVIRQTLIALRMSELLGLGEFERNGANRPVPVIAATQGKGAGR